MSRYIWTSSSRIWLLKYSKYHIRHVFCTIWEFGSEVRVNRETLGRFRSEAKIWRVSPRSLHPSLDYLLVVSERFLSVAVWATIKPHHRHWSVSEHLLGKEGLSSAYCSGSQSPHNLMRMDATRAQAYSLNERALRCAARLQGRLEKQAQKGRGCAAGQPKQRATLPSSGLRQTHHFLWQRSSGLSNWKAFLTVKGDSTPCNFKCASPCAHTKRGWEENATSPNSTVLPILGFLLNP